MSGSVSVVSDSLSLSLAFLGSAICGLFLQSVRTLDVEARRQAKPQAQCSTSSSLCLLSADRPQSEVELECQTKAARSERRQKIMQTLRVCGVGLAKQPDIPLQRAEAWGFTLLLSNEVDDAEGRDREQVGDEATGKRTKGPLNKDMTTR